MKFYHSSFYPEFHWKLVDRLFLPGILGVFGLAMLVLSLLKHDWTGIAFAFAMAAMALTFASLLSPIGWTSIYIDRTMIRVVPFRHFLRLLLPLKKTFYLNQPTHVFVDLTDVKMHISQEDSSSEVVIYSLARAERRRLAALLKKLARGNRNIDLEIDQTFVDGKRLKFAPAEKVTYSYMLRKKDRLELSIRSEIEFKVELKDLTVKDEGARILLPKQKLGIWSDEVIFQWKIKNSGMYKLEFGNPSSEMAARIEYSLTRSQRYNRVKMGKKPSMPENGGPGAAPAQINK